MSGASFNGSDAFPLVMISAMYENGGNSTQRILDGHPELFVYPFESQIGTRFVQDQWSGMYPSKYRWPEFPLSNSLQQDYAAIIDEEAKIRARTPNVSKFRDYAFELDDDQRRDRFIRIMQDVPRTRANLACAFFVATFETWKNLNRSGREHVWVGYSPIFAIDSEKYLHELPKGHILHVIRNPWSAYADTKRRPVPLSLPHYMAGWMSVQLAALAAQSRFPERIHIVRFEDIVEDPRAALDPFCDAVGISAGELLVQPSWNSRILDEIYPWGTVRHATRSENEARARELSDNECAEIQRLTAPLLERFGYADFLKSTAGSV